MEKVAHFDLHWALILELAVLRGLIAYNPQQA